MSVTTLVIVFGFGLAFGAALTYIMASRNKQTATEPVTDHALVVNSEVARLQSQLGDANREIERLQTVIHLTRPSGRAA